MQARDFCYWLQGFFELNKLSDKGPLGLNPGQVSMIQNHLNLVFFHDIDPKQDIGDPVLKDKMNKIHEGKPYKEIPFSLTAKDIMDSKNKVRC